MTYELKPTDAQGKAEEQQLRCRRCEADLDPEFEVDGFCDEHCKDLSDMERCGYGDTAGEIDHEDLLAEFEAWDDLQRLPR